MSDEILNKIEGSRIEWDDLEGGRIKLDDVIADLRDLRQAVRAAVKFFDDQWCPDNSGPWGSHPKNCDTCSERNKVLDALRAQLGPGKEEEE